MNTLIADLLERSQHLHSVDADAGFELYELAIKTLYKHGDAEVVQMILDRGNSKLIVVSNKWLSLK